MKKNDDRIDEFAYIVIFLTCLISLSFYLPGDITGQAVNDSSATVPIISASVSNRTDLEISSFSFTNPIDLYIIQNITVEAQNTGSTSYDAQITETIYNLSNGTQLNQLAVYVDSSVHMYPGNTRMHRVIFLPERIGAYFIKATVDYGPRVKEVWGSFEVVVQNETQGPPGGNQTNQTNETQQPPGGGGGSSGGGGGGGGGGGSSGTGNGSAGGGNGTSNVTTIEIVPGTPPEEITIPANVSNYSIAIEYPNMIPIYRNITNLLSIKVINNGRNTLTGINFYASYPDIFQIDINPKTPQSLQNYNDSVTYVISLRTENASLREYPFDFDVTAQQARSNGSVVLDVREAPESFRELILEKILNYEILIADISAEIEAASLKGLDARTPTAFIKSAKDGLDRTREYFDLEQYENALRELEQVEKDIRDAVFTLGNLSLRLYAVQRVDYFLLLLLLIAIIIIAAWYKRRRDKRRPRLLLQAKEE